MLLCLLPVSIDGKDTIRECVCVRVVRVRYLVLWGDVIALRAIRSSALGFDLGLLWLLLGIAVVAAAVVLGPKEALLGPQYGAFHRCWFLSFDHCCCCCGGGCSLALSPSFNLSLFSQSQSLPHSSTLAVLYFLYMCAVLWYRGEGYFIYIKEMRESACVCLSMSLGLRVTKDFAVCLLPIQRKPAFPFLEDESYSTYMLLL